jgi:DNA-binding IclR family transcriptional regulator
MAIAASEGVKSADRAMAILEIFRAARCPLTARDLADQLAMPRSSTNVLLRSLIAGGYLRYHAERSVYYPTLRVFQLGSWLAEGYLDDPAINALLTRLRDETGETVCLWARIGLGLTVMQIVESPQPIRLTVNTGARAPLFGSIVGAAMLAGLDDGAVEGLAVRQAARSGEPLDMDALRKGVARDRQRGHVLGYDRWLPDAGAVAMAIRPEGAAEPLVIGVGGPSFRVRRNEADIVAALVGCRESGALGL